ncbi:MAG: hypothetical protein Q8P67_23985 [archaeon]|nr:hypothetical protein [archaeon]
MSLTENKALYMIPPNKPQHQKKRARSLETVDFVEGSRPITDHSFNDLDIHFIESLFGVSVISLCIGGVSIIFEKAVQERLN